MLKEKDPVVALASPDVKEWVDEHLPDVENRAELRKQILRNPVNYFSRPANVPLDWRKEIYLCVSPPCTHLPSCGLKEAITHNHTDLYYNLRRPDFTLTLIRTPHLPPKYAQFWVPLWFNKLDLKDYLRRVYNVEVLHVRSYVVQSKVERKPTLGRGLFSYPTGPIHRPESKKKMTAELVNSFVWPDEITDFEPYVISNSGYLQCLVLTAVTIVGKRTRTTQHRRNRTLQMTR